MVTIPDSLGFRLDIRQLNARGTFQGQLRSGSSHLGVFHLKGQCDKTAPTEIELGDAHAAILLKGEGTLLLRNEAEPKWMVLPANSLAFVRGSASLRAVFGRGNHELDAVMWNCALTPQIDAWLAEGTRTKKGQPTCRPIEPHFLSVVDRIQTAADVTGPVQEMLMLSAAYEMVANLDQGVYTLPLASLPAHMPTTLRELGERVASQPHRSWALKDASAMAGYSPFHFSRVFKQIVGYGFHEYVDRCRTAMAVERLCEGDCAVDLVAVSCGFGSAHSLRESMKEYLGLVPSELRAMTER